MALGNGIEFGEVKASNFPVSILTQKNRFVNGFPETGGKMKNSVLAALFLAGFWAALALLSLGRSPAELPAGTADFAEGAESPAPSPPGDLPA